MSLPEKECSSGLPSGRPLANDFVGTLVVAEAEEPGLPQTILTRPLGEPYLGDELGPGPVRATRDRSHIAER